MATNLQEWVKRSVGCYRDAQHLISLYLYSWFILTQNNGYVIFSSFLIPKPKLYLERFVNLNSSFFIIVEAEGGEEMFHTHLEFHPYKFEQNKVGSSRIVSEDKAIRGLVV